ncbi:SusC/RagA family TonB-linked outer membrane protein [Rapidithrix thailandica]|uniref:SusC/RagA family TonB-linked outer membrane protein n=1 Tax=Rapidithrix thailandica TaxID=413964 RepID=A0AAW9SLV6_9BACT
MKTNLPGVLFRINKCALYSIVFQVLFHSFAIATDKVSPKESLEEITTSIGFDKVKLGEALRVLEKATGFQFTYRESKIPKTTVTIKKEKRSLADLLRSISGQSGVAFKRVDNIIYVKPIEKAGEIIIELPTEKEVSISGKVTDEGGEPLPGVNILVKQTTIGTVTDIDGNYRLSVPEDATTLVFSSVGYMSKEVEINHRKVIDMVMDTDTKTLDEIVVVGYGTQRKVNLTGAVSTVNTEELEGQPAINVASSLQGRMPGVYITQSSGLPGREGVDILIRGVGTMNNSNPMILIDGLESTQAALSAINPNDIENLSVLKDAAAASIYGTRAANGVILVTTKRGKGKPTISYNASFGVQKATRLPDHVSSADYARLLNEANINEGKAPIYTDDEIRKFETGEDPFNYPNTDWVDLMFSKAGFYHNHDVSLSGGSDMSKYRISLEYLDQDGIMEVSNHKRYNLRINLDNKVTKWLNMGLNASLTHNDFLEPVPSIQNGVREFFRQANMIPPTVANKYEDGTFQAWSNGNPIAWLDAGSNLRRKNYNFLGSIFGEVTLMEGLTLKGIMGANFSLDDDKRHKKVVHYGDGTTQGPTQVTDVNRRNRTIYLQSYLNYEKTIRAHEFKVMLGVSSQSEEYNENSAFRNNFPSNELNQLDVGDIEGMRNGGNAFEVKLASYFGRVNYILAGKYLFEINTRIDGSSKFAPDYRWGTFPSFSVGWRVSEERFMKAINWVEELKIRTSWGKLGNHNIDNYLYIARFALGQNYPFGGGMHSGAAQVVADVPDISWETSTEFNIGIDAGFFNNKLSLSLDYYNRLTEDILVNVPVSVVYGLPAPTVNDGSMRNRGIEVLLTHRNAIGQLNYSVSVNGTYNKNKVIRLANPSKGGLIRVEGEPWNSYFGYEHIGFHQTDDDADSEPHIAGLPVKAGDLKYKDQDGNGVIDDNDRVVLGNTIPEFTYGLSITMDYKGFDLSAFFQGAEKVYRTLGGNIEWPFADGGSALAAHLDRTLVENGAIVKEGHYPRTLLGGPRNLNAQMSSFVVHDASYLRMKNLQIGYNLPKTLLEKIHLSKARIYVSGQNLFTITSFPSDFDPEVYGDWTTASGSANYRYPQVKFYMMGFNLTF